MSENPNETIGLSPKPPETVLPESNPQLMGELQAALANMDHIELEKLTSQNPRDLFCWAALSAAAGEGIDGYAFSRIGYHRGLDTLRASGWRGSGYVRASVPSNRGFLACLALLKHHAGAISEDDEYERCGEFLVQLDPSYDWNSFDATNAENFLFVS